MTGSAQVLAENMADEDGMHKYDDVPSKTGDDLRKGITINL